MRVAILESISMPAGHEVEFDRILVNELMRQGHEPIFFVPANFPFKELTQIGRASCRERV